MGTGVVTTHLGDAQYRIEIRDASEAQVVALAREMGDIDGLLGKMGTELAKLEERLLTSEQDEGENARLLDQQIKDMLEASANGEDPDPPIDPSDPDQTGAALSSWPTDLLDAHNAIRSSAGLGALATNGALAAAAQSYAGKISETGILSHTGPDGSQPSDRAVAAGYPFGPPGSVVGENLAGGPPDVQQAMDGWMTSPPHRKNILQPLYDEVGFGYAYRIRGKIRHVWVAVFGAQG